MRTWGVLVAAACAILLTSIPSTPQPALATVASQHVALFGIDAGDWTAIDPLISRGELPTFARLKHVGAVGVMRADPPLLSPIIWTTIATGRPPEEHGVLDFMMDLPGGGQTPVNGAARRVKALWEIWSEAGRSVAVTGWWATWPADLVRGILVADRLMTSHLRATSRPSTGLVYPAARWPDVQRAIREPSSLDYTALSSLVPLTRREFDEAVASEQKSTATLYDNPIAHFRSALAATRTYRDLSVQAARSRPNLWAVYYEIVDTTAHLFSRDARRRDSALKSAYREVDGALADAARALPPDTFLVVLSDHGFEPPDAAIREDPANLTSGAAAWHRPYGIVAITTAGALTGVAAPREPTSLGTVSPLDIAPTLLSQAGLPIAADMPGRILNGPARDAPVTRRIATYGAHLIVERAPGAGAGGAREELERLRALGYVSGSTSVTSLARVNLGEILYRKGDDRGAIRELEAVLRVDPLNQRAALWLARAYVRADRRDDAIRLYDRLLHLVTTGDLASNALEPVVILAVTDVELSQGRVDGAARRLADLPPALRHTVESLTALGAVAEARQRWSDAEKLYREGLQREASDIECLTRLTDLLLRRGQSASALTVTSAAARASLSSARHLSLAGEAALASRRYADADRWFGAAVRLAPDSTSVRIELARARVLDQRPDAALDALRDVPSTREAEMIRGAALSGRNDWPAAVAAYLRALAAGTPDVELLNALGNAQLRAGQAVEAQKTLERSLSLKADQSVIRALLETAKQEIRGRGPGSR